MARPVTKPIKVENDNVGNEEAGEIDLGSFNLLKLHHELGSIQSSDLSAQEKNAGFIHLITRITNAVASAWYHFDLSSGAAVSEQVDSVQPLFLVQRKSDSGIDHRTQMALVAETALKQESLQITQHANDPKLSIIAAPNIITGQSARVLVQVLELGAQPVETYALIVQIVASLGTDYRELESTTIQSTESLLVDLANAEYLESALQTLCDACGKSQNQIALAATKSKTGLSLRSISNPHVLPKDATRVNDITRAMLEAAKYDQTLIIDRLDANKTRAPLLYKALDAMQCKALTFVPIKGKDSELHSMLVIGGENKQALSELTQVLQPTATLIHSILKNKADGLLGKWRYLHSNLLSSSVNQRIAFAATALLFICLMFLPIEYRIEASVVVEPVQKRIVTAPFDAVIDEVYVEPGARVVGEDGLLKLDDEELLLKKTQLLADVKRAKKQKDIELANGTAAQVQILQFEISELQAKIDLVDYQLENLLVTAPLNGLVVIGDLKRREGAAVTTGEALFEIAPLQRVVVETAVPAEDINRVEVGMPVDIRITALPEETLTSEVSAIHLRSTIRESRHVYVVESELDNANLLLKPGMIGYAKISAGEYSLAWVWFHRAWQKIVELLFW